MAYLPDGPHGKTATSKTLADQANNRFYREPAISAKVLEVADAMECTPNPVWGRLYDGIYALLYDLGLCKSCKGFKGEWIDRKDPRHSQYPEGEDEFIDCRDCKGTGLTNG